MKALEKAHLVADCIVRLQDIEEHSSMQTAHGVAMEGLLDLMALYDREAGLELRMASEGAG
jgi:hypothetical protein